MDNRYIVAPGLAKPDSKEAHFWEGNFLQLVDNLFPSIWNGAWHIVTKRMDFEG